MYLSWKRKWQLTPEFLPGESHGQRSLVGYSSWDRRESDMTEVHLSTHARTTLMGGIFVLICMFLLTSQDELFPQIYWPLRIPPLWIASSHIGLFIFSYWSVGLLYILGTHLLFVFCLVNIFPSCGCSFNLASGILFYFFCHTKYFKDFLWAHRPLIHSVYNSLYGGT